MSDIETIERQPPPLMPGAILCTIPQAAAMIGRGQTFIYGAIGDGRIDAVKSDKRTLVVVESLHRYAASLPSAKIKPLTPRRRAATAPPPPPPRRRRAA